MSFCSAGDTIKGYFKPQVEHCTFIYIHGRQMDYGYCSLKKNPGLLSHSQLSLCLTISGAGLPWKPYFDPNKMKQNVDTAGSIIEVWNVWYLIPYIYFTSSYVFKFKLILYLTWTLFLFVSDLISAINLYFLFIYCA